MAGFQLAKAVYHAIQGVDWSALRAIVLLNHGLITFADDARQSYEHMLEMVSEAEAYLSVHAAFAESRVSIHPAPPDPLAVSRLRRAVSEAAGKPMIAHVAATPESQGFAARPEAAQWVAQGPLTPDHVSRAKRTPMLVTGDDPEADVARFVAEYRAYFARHARPEHVMLDPGPRWALWPGVGTVAFGHTLKMAGVNADIVVHTLRVMQECAVLGGYQVPSEDHFFDIEYWELQQAKHKHPGAEPPLTGRIALVAEADGPIGRACAEALAAQGAAVVALGADPDLPERWQGTGKLGLICDLVDAAALDEALGALAVARFRRAGYRG